MKKQGTSFEIKVGVGLLIAAIAFVGIRGMKKRQLARMEAEKLAAIQAERAALLAATTTTLPQAKPAAPKMSAAESLALASKSLEKMKMQSLATVRRNANKQYTDQEVQNKIRAITSQNISSDQKALLLTDLHDEIAISKTNPEIRKQLLRKVDSTMASFMSPPAQFTRPASSSPSSHH